MKLRIKLQTPASPTNPVTLYEEFPSFTTDNTDSSTQNNTSQSSITILPPLTDNYITVPTKSNVSLPSSSTNTPTKSSTINDQCTELVNSNLTLKQTITDYYSPKCRPKQDQGTKRKINSPQEKGPIPPGQVGYSSNKSIVVDSKNDSSSINPS